MNDPRTQLKDLIHVEKGIIPANLCDHIISDIETREWRPHTWYNAVQGSYGSEETMDLVGFTVSGLSLINLGFMLVVNSRLLNIKMN